MYKIYLKQNNNNKKRNYEIKSLDNCCTLQWEFLQTVFANVRRELVWTKGTRVIVAIRTADLLPSVPNGATAEPQPTRRRDVISAPELVDQTDWTPVNTVFRCVSTWLYAAYAVFGWPREFSMLESRICIMFFCSFQLWHNVLRLVFMVRRKRDDYSAQNIQAIQHAHSRHGEEGSWAKTRFIPQYFQSLNRI